MKLTMVTKKVIDLQLPNITARSWLVWDKVNEVVVEAHKMNKRMEVASLTKIMTFCVCWEVLKRHHLDPTK